MDDLDLLVEEAALAGEVAAGYDPAYLAAGRDARLVAVVAARQERQHRAFIPWTAEEEEFVRRHVGWLTDEEIGRRIGRTADAVHIRRERYLDLPNVTKRDDWLTAQEVRRRLGAPCAKGVTRLIRSGILPGRMAPLERDVYLVHVDTLTRFAVNPENWIYFRTYRVKDARLRRLIALREERWGDAWWTPGQVAAYHGVTGNAVNAQIHKGLLPARRFGNWWVKRSEAVQARFYLGQGRNLTVEWTDASDCFLLMARSVGCSHADIEALCKWPHGRAAYRLNALRRDGRIPDLIRRYDLDLYYDAESSRLFADWRQYRRKFPRWEGAVGRFLAGEASLLDLQQVVKLLAVWGEWYGPTEVDRALASSFRHFNSVTPATVWQAYETVKEWGVDPLC